MAQTVAEIIERLNRLANPDNVAGMARDDRNFVKKAVNWALRQIGKRNAALHRNAVATARAIQANPCASARWIANDALRELTSEKVLARLSRS